MPSISFIVARSFPGGVIGDNNKLPWRLKSDLKRFRQITTGHVVIMGRMTFESIGRPLPNRTNIVLSRNSSLTNSGGINFDEGTHLYWTNTFEDALLVADIISVCRQQKDIFVIGGQTMYDLFGDLVNKVFLTEVFADVRGDSYFKTKFPRKQWKLVSEEDFSKSQSGDEYSYRFSIYERKDRKNRYEFVSRFFADRVKKDEWLSGQVRRHKSNIIEYFQGTLDVFQANHDASDKTR
jgi:dihydrofolate reductase